MAGPKKEEIQQAVRDAHFPVKPEDGMLKAGAKHLANLLWKAEGLQDFAKGLTDAPAGAVDKFLGTNLKAEGDGKGETDTSMARAAGRLPTEFVKQFFQEPGGLKARQAGLGGGIMDGFEPLFDPKDPTPSTRSQKDVGDKSKMTMGTRPTVPGGAGTPGATPLLGVAAAAGVGAPAGGPAPGAGGPAAGGGAPRPGGPGGGVI